MRTATFRRPAAAWATGVTAATLMFGRVQNQGHLTGGDISLAKTLWLNLTILCFLVLPALWWRDRLVDARLRAVFGAVFVAFALRAAIELPVLYLTDWWRCSYGIAHDLATAGVALALLAGALRDGAPRRNHANARVWFVVTLLLVEAGFARAFCSVADPASGVYFAGGAPRFDAINRATWAVVAAAYPILALLVTRPAGANLPLGPQHAPRDDERPHAR